MAVRVRIDPIEKVTTATIRSDLSLPEQKRAVADFARGRIEEARQTNRAILGRVPPNQTWVDGRVGAALESVNPSRGKIITEFELMVDVLRWIADMLMDRSPERSGDYKRGHQIFADGKDVRIGQEIPLAQEYVFTNFVPYARKLEIGKTKSGRPFVVQVPNRIYERTAKDARSRFGNIARIAFSYQSVRGGAIDAWARSAQGQRHASRRRGGAPASRMEWLTRQPAIVVRSPDALRSRAGVS